MSIQTQSGLAANLANLAASGLPLEHLRDFPAAVEALTADDVIEVSRKYLDPQRLQTVLVGDVATIEPEAAVFGAVERDGG
jgi:zinc protease